MPIPCDSDSTSLTRAPWEELGPLPHDQAVSKCEKIMEMGKKFNHSETQLTKPLYKSMKKEQPMTVYGTGRWAHINIKLLHFQDFQHSSDIPT